MALAQDIFSLLWPPAAMVLAALLLVWLAKWSANRSAQGTSGLLYQLFSGLLVAFAMFLFANR